tara:strand:+ start:578 stop:2323 length:1746 start_codon:yes stop_codon:yes gene_type:complete
MYRSHNCGELNIKNVNENVTLSGWVHSIRNLGSMIFIDLRDRYGITQLAADITNNKNLFKTIKTINREFVIKISGIVKERSSKNKNINTGEIEIIINKINILSSSETPPFTIEKNTDGGEELRLKYRYLDLRRKNMSENIILRHKIASETRNFLIKNNFLEIETPFLIKSTPEGARDFIVPSRLNTGEFYALPQSPQTFKQLLMVAGFDKYFQLVKCFRDEDFRADRQPEFTQIDCEMSFIEEKDIYNIFSKYVKHIIKKIGQEEINEIPKITFKDAIDQYGSDKPDLRFDLKIKNINEVCQNKGFNVFDKAENISAFFVKNQAAISRKEIDLLTDFVKSPQIGGNGLIYIKVNRDGSYKSSIDKFFNQNDLKKIQSFCKAEKGDIIFIICGKYKKTKQIIGDLRLEIIKKLNINPKNKFAPVWITDFPLFDFDEASKQLYAMHHPFTAPKKNNKEILEKTPEKVIAQAYDIVLNGQEIGGGSIRIFDQNTQNKIFELLGLSKKEIKNKFGFLLNAFKYGAPPHGGIAFGFDRICSIMANEKSIRDVIAFPKNNAGKDLMIDSPSTIDQEQLKDLNIKIDE